MLATKGVASSPRVGCEDEAVVSASLAPICSQGRGLIMETFVVRPSLDCRCFVDYALHPLISNWDSSFFTWLEALQAVRP